MEYDEIDRYVEDLFRQDKSEGSGEVQSGDWRIDRIDEIIQDTYDEAIWWHNNRISEGTDPESGLRSLPYIPWDEKIDGQAAMMGNAGINETSFERYGGHWRQYGTRTRTDSTGGGEIEGDRFTMASGLAVLALVVVAFIVGMVLFGPR